MEQILIGEEISLLKKGRGVSGEIMPGPLHLLGSYRQVALGESGCVCVCKYRAFIRKMRVCAILGLVVIGYKNLSCFGAIKPGECGEPFAWGNLCLSATDPHCLEGQMPSCP